MSYFTYKGRFWSCTTRCKSSATSTSIYLDPEKFATQAPATVSVSSIALLLYYLAGLPMTLHSKRSNYKHWQETLEEQMFFKKWQGCEETQWRSFI